MIRTLLVTPTQSGETVTAVHVAKNLVDRGHRAAFVASPGARRQIPPCFLENLFELTGDAEDNLSIWKRALETFAPHIVLFADYPILASSRSSSPLGCHREWHTDLQGLRACLVTFDHLGLGQCQEELTVGPRHLCPQRVTFPTVPDGMRIMLPCPMQHPGSLEGRWGDPFRYWSVPLGLPDDLRREVRRTYLGSDDDLLILHSVPAWAWKAAEALKLPFYRFLPEIYSYYFEGISKPVTLVSVNNGSLLTQPSGGSFRIINRPPLPIAEFERLLFSADLILTENKPSFTIGMAVCALRPSAVLKNSFGFSELSGRMPPRLGDCVAAMEQERPGAVFPFEIFPTDMTRQLDKLWLYRGNALVGAFEELEIFEGEQTTEQLARLLEDREAQDTLRARQQAYVEMLQQTDEATDLLERYLSEWGSGPPPDASRLEPSARSS
jgi:Family of unknown function (DUF6365)